MKPYLKGFVATMRRFRDDCRKAQNVTIAPPVDEDIVPGAYAEILGLQKHSKRQPQGPPQSKTKRVIRAQTKRKLTQLPQYQPAN